MSKCHYTYNPKSNTGYLSMKNLPNWKFLFYTYIQV
jgi:hypothetical protein